MSSQGRFDSTPRLAQNRWRRPVPETVSLEEGRERPDPSAGLDPLQGMIAEDRARRLWLAVESLTTRERVVVVLFYQQELTVREVADNLGVSTGTVKTLLFRARRRLRSMLQNQGENA